VAGGAVVWSQFLQPAQTAESFAQREFITGRAQQTDVRLPDGSVVTLAPESRLRIADDFGAQAREVHLTGQAAFQVTHDVQRAFRVHAAGVTTEVLGTHFAVRAYADDPDMSVALVDGRVRVRSSADGEEARALTLRPGQVARAAGGNAPRIDDEASVAVFLAWTEGELVFEDTPLSQVAHELGRWYDVDIQLADTSLSERRLTATLGREPIAEVLELIVLSLDLRYERAGREIVLSTR
jgi:ferric-dicitrate binding protein FerR (iron transport regulator)